jgi:hypothetical protein
MPSRVTAMRSREQGAHHRRGEADANAAISTVFPCHLQGRAGALVATGAVVASPRPPH